MFYVGNETGKSSSACIYISHCFVILDGSSTISFSLILSAVQILVGMAMGGYWTYWSFPLGIFVTLSRLHIQIKWDGTGSGRNWDGTGQVSVTFIAPFIFCTCFFDVFS